MQILKQVAGATEGDERAAGLGLPRSPGTCRQAPTPAFLSDWHR